MPLMTTSQAAQVNNNNLISQSVTRSAILYVGGTKSVTLTVPYVHFQSHLNLMGGGNLINNSLGCFQIYVLNALRVGSSAPINSVNISIFASFPDSDFAIINPTSHSLVAQGGIQTKVTNVNIDKVFDSTIDAHTSGDQFKGGDTKVDASASPMDKPNIACNPAPVMTRMYPYFTNTSNLDYCANLDMCASSMPMVKPEWIGTDEDEMSLRYLVTKMSYFSVFQMTPSDVVGQSLFVRDLMPGTEFLAIPGGSSVQPTLLSFVSLPFSFWRGSLTYKLVAVCTSVHTARLQICSHVGFQATGLTIDEAFGQYSMIFDIVGTSEITFTFPWRSVTQWKKVCNGSYTDLSDYSMGQFSVRVLNTLQLNESVSNTIDVNVYVCGGPDYELAYIGNNCADWVPSGYG